MMRFVSKKRLAKHECNIIIHTHTNKAQQRIEDMNIEQSFNGHLPNCVCTKCGKAREQIWLINATFKKRSWKIKAVAK